MTVLTPAEVHALAEAMPHHKAAVYVAATCGLRAGELWALPATAKNTANCGSIRCLEHHAT